MNSTPDTEKNIKSTFQWLEKAVDVGVDWVVLPEMFVCLGEQKDIWSAAKRSHEVIDQLKEFTRHHSITLFAGSIPEAVDGQRKVFNTLVVLNSQGELGRYRKIHLFHLEDGSGSVLVSERDDYQSGDEIKVLDVDGWRVGLAICYDLRFPELFASMSKEQALDAIVLPSAFTRKTGQLHWELLLRARAVEQQCYVLGANQTGDHTATKNSFGHSMVVDPWGKVVANSFVEESLCVTTIDKLRLSEVRNSIPVLSDRRFEVYQ